MCCKIRFRTKICYKTLCETSHSAFVMTITFQEDDVDNLSSVMRKIVFGVSDQVRYEPGCTATEDSLILEILALGRREVAKTKALISCASTTAQLICDFVFAYAKIMVSHDGAPLSDFKQYPSGFAHPNFTDKLLNINFITQTCPCNIQQYFTAVKMINFR